MEFTLRIDLDDPDYVAPSPFPRCCPKTPDEPDSRDAIVNAMVYVHQSVDRANGKLAKRQGRFNYVTPRHYLDFIHHYTSLFDLIRGDLEEQQRHLNVGLTKLRETEEQVKDLQVSLAEKNVLLTTKNEEAAAKLKQMVQDQQEAEVKKVDSTQISEQVRQLLRMSE